MQTDPKIDKSPYWIDPDWDGTNTEQTDMSRVHFKPKKLKELFRSIYLFLT